jgi:membrane protein YqaA with SNARE-associated domain
MISISILIFINKSTIQQLGAFGYIGVFLLCFICNATVLLPAPSLLVVVSAATALNPILVALAGALGTTLGEMVGYFSGYAGGNVVEKKDNKYISLLIKYGLPVVFIFALIPMPLFDISGVASGYLRIKWYKFLIACFLGKSIKMLIYALGADYFKGYLTI